MELYNEYDQPQAMVHAYCHQIPASEYEKQGATETEKALRDLMDYLEKNPTVYKKVLVRKKQEEAENAGIFSFVKCKVLEAVKGPDYMQDDVSNEETLHKLGQLQHKMATVYNYTQEANNSKKRFSRRIAAKKAKAAQNRSNTPANFKKPSTASGSKRKAPPPPPPPPPPPNPPPSMSSPGTSDDEVFIRSVLPVAPCRRPPLHPDERTLLYDCSVPAPPPPPPANLNRRALKERTNINDKANLSPIYKSTPIKPPLTPKPHLTPVAQSNLKRRGSTSSLSSISSVHDELLSFDRSRLKSVSKTKSPGGLPFKTPQSKLRVLSASVVRASITDICGISTVSANAFNQKMVEKFRNARSPVVGVNSPASGLTSPASGFNSPTGFTP